jgi:hypothetical protein
MHQYYMMTTPKHIARIHDASVHCLACLGEDDSSMEGTNTNGARLFLANIMPYRQTCHSCGKVLSEGQSPRWSELFPCNHPPITEGVNQEEMANFAVLLLMR